MHHQIRILHIKISLLFIVKEHIFSSIRYNFRSTQRTIALIIYLNRNSHLKRFSPHNQITLFLNSCATNRAYLPIYRYHLHYQELLAFRSYDGWTNYHKRFLSYFLIYSIQSLTTFRRLMTNDRLRSYMISTKNYENHPTTSKAINLTHGLKYRLILTKRTGIGVNHDDILSQYRYWFPINLYRQNICHHD